MTMVPPALLYLGTPQPVCSLSSWNRAPATFIISVLGANDPSVQLACIPATHDLHLTLLRGLSGPRETGTRLSLRHSGLGFLCVQHPGRTAEEILAAESGAGPAVPRRGRFTKWGRNTNPPAACVGLKSKAQLPFMLLNLQLGIIVKFDCSVLGTS